MSELTETLEEVESAIRRYSEELIQALALRDELDYEKEVHCFLSSKHALSQQAKTYTAELRTSPKNNYVINRIQLLLSHLLYYFL